MLNFKHYKCSCHSVDSSDVKIELILFHCIFYLSLPQSVQKNLQATMKATSMNTGLTLILALSYSGRWEITNAIKQIAKKDIALIGFL